MNTVLENYIINRIEEFSKKSGSLSESDIQELNVLAKLMHEKNEGEKNIWEANEKIDRLSFEREKFERELERDITKIEKESFGDRMKFAGDVVRGIAGPLLGTGLSITASILMTRSAYALEVNGGVPPKWLRTPKNV